MPYPNKKSNKRDFFKDYEIERSRKENKKSMLTISVLFLAVLGCSIIAIVPKSNREVVIVKEVEEKSKFYMPNQILDRLEYEKSIKATRCNFKYLSENEIEYLISNKYSVTKHDVYGYVITW